MKLGLVVYCVRKIISNYNIIVVVIIVLVIMSEFKSLSSYLKIKNIPACHENQD